MLSGPDEAMATPPLPTEIWNLAVVVTICVLMGWAMRITRILLTSVDVRHAVNSDAVLYLKDLGASLHVLENASMWHFQQLLRTNVEPVSTKMKRVQIPFDIVSSSIEIKCANADANADVGPQRVTNPTNILTFRVRSSVQISVQVLWSVRCESLELSSAPSGRADSSTAVSRHDEQQRAFPPILRSLSLVRTVRSLRGAPMRLSRVHRQRRRHELQDEAATENERIHSPVSNGNPPIFEVGDFRSHSEILSYDLSAASEDVVSVLIPLPAVSCPQDELQSLMDEVDSHVPGSSLGPLSTLSTTAAPSAPRYAAVIVIRTVPTGPTRTSLISKLGGRRATSSSDAESNNVLCQCIALDFLPTPLKPERFSPAVVKKISYTKSDAYISQEIYGRDLASGSECTICLEGVLSVVLLPCRHFCVCRVCLEEIDRCPICRAKFTTYVCYDGGDGDGEGDESIVSDTVTTEVKVA